MRSLTLSWHHALPTILGFGLVLSASLAVAQSATQSQEKYQRIWRHADLYQNPGDGLVRDFSLSGRLQADYAWFDADEGDYDSARWRRFRFGFTSLLADKFTVRLEGDFDLNNSPSDFYQRLTDAHVDWQVSEKTSLKILKHSAGFTLDGITSSKKLLTPERNNLTNNLWFTAEYFTGISLSGKLDKRLSYKAGVFSSDDSDEWGLTNASYFTHTSLSYDWAVRPGPGEGPGDPGLCLQRQGRRRQYPGFWPCGFPFQPMAAGELGTADRPLRRRRLL